MSDEYSGGDGGAGFGASGRPLTREPFRGNRIRNRQTGEVRVWVGDRYVGANDRARLTTTEREQLAQAEAAAANYQQHLPDLNRFEELNRTVPTGAWFQRFGQSMPTGPAPRLFSWDANGDAPGGGPNEFEEMRAITNRLTPDQREPGSGSSSNLDVTMFREGLPNIGRGGPANSRIIEGFRRQQRDAQDYADFLNWYFPQTGSLTNAQAHFQQYRTARARNPRLTWQEFFGSQQGGGQQSGGNQGNGASQGVERWGRDAQGNLVRQR